MPAADKPPTMQPVQKTEGDKLSGGSAVRERGGSRRNPRKPASGRNRTSRFIGVGASNRKNQWQARILVHGKVCPVHLFLSSSLPQGETNVCQGRQGTPGR